MAMAGRRDALLSLEIASIKEYVLYVHLESARVQPDVELSHLGGSADSAK